jgi:hypothetical protein
MGVGIVVRDASRAFQAALVSTLPSICNPEVAEAMAAWRAVLFCEELGVNRAVFEGDYLNMVNAINSSKVC